METATELTDEERAEHAKTLYEIVQMQQGVGQDAKRLIAMVNAESREIERFIGIVHHSIELGPRGPSLSGTRAFYIPTSDPNEAFELHDKYHEQTLASLEAEMMTAINKPNIMQPGDMGFDVSGIGRPPEPGGIIGG